MTSDNARRRSKPRRSRGVAETKPKQSRARSVLPTRGGTKRCLLRLTRTAKPAQNAGPRVQSPMRFLLALVVPRSARPSSSLVFITRVTNDSISIHICSDWSMRETIVSGVSCAPTARPTDSLSAPHQPQTKSVCCAFYTRDPQ